MNRRDEMNEDQFKAASNMKEEQRKIRQELEVWEKELTGPHKLGYLQGWNNNHATKLETSIPAEIFHGFRAASMNALRLRLSDIDRAFAEI